MREKFNSTIRPHYQETHTPQCRKCMRFYPWGGKAMHVHHIVPIMDGGTNDESNLITLCADCHNEWHQYCEGVFEFEEWLRMVPSWIILAVYLNPDKSKRALFHNIEETWPYAREMMMVSEPRKSAAFRAYTDHNCDNWVDW